MTPDDPDQTVSHVSSLLPPFTPTSRPELSRWAEDAAKAIRAELAAGRPFDEFALPRVWEELARLTSILVLPAAEAQPFAYNLFDSFIHKETLHLRVLDLLDRLAHAPTPTPVRTGNPAGMKKTKLTQAQRRRKVVEWLRQFARSLPATVNAKLHSMRIQSGGYQPIVGLEFLARQWADLARWIERGGDTPPPMATSAPTEEVFRNESLTLQLAAVAAADKLDQIKGSVPGGPSLSSARPLVPVSQLDLPAVRGSISDLYRVLESPAPANDTARRVYRWGTGRTTLGEQSPDSVGAGALIGAAIEWVIYHMGDHTRAQCPEVADSQLDLETKAALLELRQELLPPFTSHTLATDSGVRVRFLAFLAGIIGRVDAKCAAQEPKTAPVTAEAPLPAGPDGPFGTDRFRLGGVPVEYGNAEDEYRLIGALWDAAGAKPADAKPVETVIAAVWGEENETSGDTFRQLCYRARKRLEKVACPFTIKTVRRGMVALVRC